MREAQLFAQQDSKHPHTPLTMKSVAFICTLVALALAAPPRNMDVFVDFEPHQGERSVVGFRDGHAFHFTIHLSKGQVVRATSAPGDLQLEIHSRLPSALDMGDRAYLLNVLRENPRAQAAAVDSLPEQTARLAGLLAEWPETLPIDFVFDADAEEARHAADAAHDRALPAGAQAPDVPAAPGGGMEGGRPRRHLLAYTSLCNNMFNWFQVTHDGPWLIGCNSDRWEDKNTYYAYISNHAAGPCSDGTYFWKNSQWVCYEPDHDTSVEYAYGDCFGRCGAGCGGSGAGAYTVDCADHDSCVRFGHALAAVSCDDEFTFTADDAMFAPNCL
jgi:hypothetical protein